MLMQLPDNLTPLQQRAVACVQAGMIVVPIRADGSKAPSIRWKDLEHQTVEDVLRLITPDTQGIGIVCGAPSGHLHMFEFEGRATALKLHLKFRDRLFELGYRDLYDRISGWQERTPSGGIHLHWRCPEQPIGNLKLANNDQLEVLIETRGDGGQVVIAPSHGSTHKTGKPWETRRGGPEHCPTITAAEQQILLDLARTFGAQPLEQPVATEQPASPALTVTTGSNDIRELIDRFNREHTWQTILDGIFEWVGTPDANGIQRLRFIGQESDTGATLNATGNDTLIVFSSTAAAAGWQTWDGNGPAPSYDRFSAWCHIHHNGDRLAALRALGLTSLDDQGDQIANSINASKHAHQLATNYTHTIDFDTPDETTEPTNPIATSLIDWTPFWTTDHTATDWLIEPLIPQGRAVAMYAGAKTGKSYVTLAAAAAAATGQPFLHHPGGTPIHILYIDYEMTEADLHERLTTFGYGPQHDLSHLHYALLPTLPPLNTKQGGEQLLAAAQACNAQLVIIDTTSRSVDGDENDSRTYHDFYNHTGMLLKRHNIAWCRLDHAGKDTNKGQRGSSAKDSDVDIVIRLDKTDQGVRIVCTHRRIGWYPEHTNITINDTHYPVTFTLADDSYVAGTKHLIDTLDELGAPDDIGRPAAHQLLVDNHIEHTQRQLKDALRHRKQFPDRRLENLMSPARPARDQSETDSFDQRRDQPP